MSDEMGITPVQAELIVRIRSCAAELMGDDVLRDNKLAKITKTLDDVLRGMCHEASQGRPGQKGIRFVVRPDDRRVVENGVMKSERLFGCWDIGELVVEDGVIELEDGCLYGLPNLRRLSLPASLKKICDLGDSLEEIEFAKGCSCAPRFWRAGNLRHLVWPGKCETCRKQTFFSCRNLRTIVGFDVVRSIYVNDLKTLDSVDVSVRDDIELFGIDANEDIPQKFHGMLMHRRPQAVSLLGVMRDRSKSIAERVDAWLELTSSNMCIRALADDVRDDALRNDLPLYYKKFPRIVENSPQSSSVNGRAVLEKLLEDSYSGMRLRMDLTGARLYEKWVSYAWSAGKYAVIEGLLRDRHPVMAAWVRKTWGKPMLFLLANVRRPKIVEAMEICFPGTIQAKLGKEGCSRALWELFVETDNWGDSRRLFWNKGIENKNMSEFVETCAREAEPLIRLGADPNQKGKLGFSWNDVMDGLKRRYCKKP